MKHIKLFEDFGQMGQGPALIVATGDWTGITKTGEAVDFTVPAVVNVTYYTNPTPEQMSQITYGQEEVFSPEDAVAEIIGGDQGGTNLYKDNQEGVAILVDKSQSPKEIKREIQRIINVFNEGGDTGADQFTSVLEDPNAKDIYTPKYLAHCRTSAGNGIGPKILMKRRVNFQVV